MAKKKTKQQITVTLPLKVYMALTTEAEDLDDGDPIEFLKRFLTDAYTRPEGAHLKLKPVEDKSLKDHPDLFEAPAALTP